MKKVLIVGLSLALVAGALIAPADAKKKKKKKKPPVVTVPVQVDQTFFLRAQAEPACSEPTKFFLSVETAEDGAGACGNLAFGLPTEALIAAEQDEGFEYVFAATDGVPFVLDAAKKISGVIGVSSFKGAAQNPGGVSAGLARLEIAIDGTTAEGSSALGNVVVEYVVTPDKGTYEVEFEMDVPAELDKKTLTGLSITLRNRGATVLHGFYTVDAPDSQFTVGAWK